MLLNIIQHRTAPTTKNCPTPKVNSAEVEKPQSSLRGKKADHATPRSAKEFVLNPESKGINLETFWIEVGQEILRGVEWGAGFCNQSGQTEP